MMSQDRKHGRSALITGGSRGLGARLAEQLTQTPYLDRILLVARNPDTLIQSCRHIESRNPALAVIPLVADLSTASGCDKLLERLKGEEVDILINNAGMGALRQLEEYTSEEMEKTYYCNAIAPLRLIQHVAPHIKQQRWGRIINISSISIRKPGPWLSLYASTKAALQMLSQCTHMELVSFGVTCNTILPGLMLTDLGHETLRFFFPDAKDLSCEDIRSTLAAEMPSGVIDNLPSVCSLVKYLVSEEADAVSGNSFCMASGHI